MTNKINIDKTRIPTHVAIIMDGNGRWAKKHGNERIYGHQHGVKSVKNVVEEASPIGVKYLTLYAFSTENWNRPKYEVDALMSLLVSTIHSELKLLNDNNVSLMAIGDIKSLPTDVQEELNEAINITSKNTGLKLVLALSYSSRWEIINAVKKIATDVKNGKLEIDNINTELFSSYLTTKGIPDPDLLIRTSGEIRLSNFLLWQLSYSEFYFTEKLWPDFGKEDFLNAIFAYQNRERRFGKTGEQIANK
jgi:undecaprenyl diphosphate synthase